jgi:hypothetical protein
MTNFWKSIAIGEIEPSDPIVGRGKRNPALVTFSKTNQFACASNPR